MDVAYSIKRLALLRAFTRDFAPLQDSSGFLGRDGDGFRAGFEATPHGDLARGLAADCGRAVLSLRPWMRPDIAQAIEPMQATPETAWLTYIVRMAETTPCHPYPVRMTADAFVVRPFFRQSREALELLQRHLAKLAAEHDAQAASSDEHRAASKNAVPSGIREGTAIADLLRHARSLVQAKARQNALDAGSTAGQADLAADNAAAELEGLGRERLHKRLAGMGLLSREETESKQFAERLGYHSREVLGWKAAKPKASDITVATKAQGQELVGATGSSRRKSAAERSTGSSRLCDNCKLYPITGGAERLRRHFCETCLDGNRPAKLKGILDGNVVPDWKSADPAALAEARRQIAEAEGGGPLA